MICQHSRKFFLLLAVLLFLSSVLYSEVCLEDVEFEELMIIFARLETQPRELQITITSLETSLATAQDLQGKLQLEIETTQATLAALKKSLDSQKHELTLKAVGWGVLASLISAGIGIIVGLLL
jgi:hypothetical protein